MMVRKLAPMHPGEVLREEFLLPLGLSPGALAKACGVPRTRIERLSNEATGVTADTALRLSKAFGTSPELWLNLQTDYDIQTAKRQIGKELARIEPIATKAAWTIGDFPKSNPILMVARYITGRVLVVDGGVTLQGPERDSQDR
jgi:antitoxin HigA-1